MEVYLRRYFWVVIPLVIAACAFFAAKAIGQLVVGALPAAKPRRPAPLIQTVAPGGVPHDLARVVQRNIFCASCDPIAPVHASDDPAVAEAGGTSPDQEANGEPVKSSLEYRLLATLVCDDDRAYSYAAFSSPSENKVAMYGIGSKLSDEATVTDIMDRRVILENGGRAEYIELAMDGEGRPEPPDRSSPVRANPRSRRHGELDALNEEVQKGVRKLGDNKWEIQRSALNKVLSNTTLLARSARIVPSLKDGKPFGFKLYAIRPGSIYSLIGMKNGDTIQAVNGQPMTTPDKALEVYTKVRNASHLTISFSRRGNTQTHDYIIR